jgi:hypothetical protein
MKTDANSTWISGSVGTISAERAADRLIYTGLALGQPRRRWC